MVELIRWKSIRGYIVLKDILSFIKAGPPTGLSESEKYYILQLFYLY